MRNKFISNKVFLQQHNKKVCICIWIQFSLKKVKILLSDVLARANLIYRFRTVRRQLILAMSLAPRGLSWMQIWLLEMPNQGNFLLLLLPRKARGGKDCSLIRSPAPSRPSTRSGRQRPSRLLRSLLGGGSWAMIGRWNLQKKLVTFGLSARR